MNTITNPPVSESKAGLRLAGYKIDSAALASALAWYNSLQPRERQLMIAAAAMLFILALYFLIWRPFNNNLASLRLGVETAKSNLVFMQDAQAKVASTKPQAGNGTGPNLQGQSILTVVESTRDANQIPPFKRIEADSKNGVRITIDKAPFDNLIQWVGRLKRQYGLIVSDIILDSQEESGLVNVKVILAAPPT